MEKGREKIEAKRHRKNEKGRRWKLIKKKYDKARRFHNDGNEKRRDRKKQENQDGKVKLKSSEQSQSQRNKRYKNVKK